MRPAHKDLEIGYKLEPISYAQHMASYKKPKSVDIVDDLPKNFQGKTLKRVLRDRYWQGRERRV